MFCRIKRENISSWAKRKERNINFSFWPKQTKEEKAKGPLNRQTWAEHRRRRNSGPLRNRPGEGSGNGLAQGVAAPPSTPLGPTSLWRFINAMQRRLSMVSYFISRQTVLLGL
jgi:hypothetical protein